MTELQEIAYTMINDNNLFQAADWQKMKSAKDIKNHILGYKNNSDLLTDYEAGNISSFIADIMFIEQININNR